MIPPIELFHMSFLGPIGIQELLILLLIILILFGAKKIPQLARGLGKGITEFKAGLKDSGKDAESSKEIDENSQGKEIEENSRDEA